MDIGNSPMSTFYNDLVFLKHSHSSFGKTFDDIIIELSIGYNDVNF